MEAQAEAAWSSQVPGASSHAPPVPPLLLTTRQTCAALSMGQTKVRELIASGALGAVRIGHSLRIPRADVERYVERLRAEAAEG